jgi:hypothetical protein
METTLKTRRQAIALAAMLTATVVTAIAAVGGLSRWGSQPPTASSTPAAAAVQQAPPAAPVEELGD